MLLEKVVVITGASSGIGAEMAKLLAKHGAIPVLMARSEDKLREVATTIEGAHGIEVMDVTSDESVERAMTVVKEKYGKIDILINNAGYGFFDSFDRMELQAFRDMMEVNYFGMLRCIQAVLPDMVKRGEGHIINIASMAGKIGSPKSAAYSATKHAVLGMTNSLRHEVRKQGVTISSVNPGPIRTAFFDKADPSGDYLSRLPRWLILDPEKVAQAVLKMIRTKRTELDLPWSAGFSVRLAGLLPRLSDRIAGMILNKK